MLGVGNTPHKAALHQVANQPAAHVGRNIQQPRQLDAAPMPLRILAHQEKCFELGERFDVLGDKLLQLRRESIDHRPGIPGKQTACVERTRDEIGPTASG